MQKTFAILLAAIFVLSPGIMPAHAQAQPGAFAYIPLVSPGDDPALPVEFRARQAFEKLAPILLQAQARGEIIRFEPDLPFGFLKVEYQAGFDLAAALSVVPGDSAPIYDNPQSVLEYTQVSLTRPAVSPPVTDGGPLIEIPLYSSCFSMEGLGATDFYKAYLLDASGRLVTSTSGYIGSSGNASGCLSRGTWTELAPGYSFILHEFDHAGTTPVNTYSTTIARLSVTSLSIKTKTIKGTAPANSQLGILLTHFELDALNHQTFTTKDINASSKGAWMVNFGTAGMRGGDLLQISWTNTGTDFSFLLYSAQPYGYCDLGGAYCGAQGIPGKNAKISAVHAKKTYKISGRFDTEGWFGAEIMNASADPVFLAAGDKVSGTGFPTHFLPTLTAIPDYTADTVFGTAPASSYFYVALFVYNQASSLWSGYVKWVGSDATGNYVVDFSYNFDILPTDRLYTTVSYINPLTGNSVYYVNYIDP